MMLNKMRICCPETFLQQHRNLSLITDPFIVNMCIRRHLRLIEVGNNPEGNLYFADY